MMGPSRRSSYRERMKERRGAWTRGSNLVRLIESVNTFKKKGNDGIHSITGGLNYYIHGDDLKLMVNYIHTWSDFREANPEFGDDQFNEVIGRVQVMF